MIFAAFPFQLRGISSFFLLSAVGLVSFFFSFVVSSFLFQCVVVSAA